jgi:hypothetical protein
VYLSEIVSRTRRVDGVEASTTLPDAVDARMT